MNGEDRGVGRLGGEDAVNGVRRRVEPPAGRVSVRAGERRVDRVRGVVEVHRSVPAVRGVAVANGHGERRALGHVEDDENLRHNAVGGHLQELNGVAGRDVVLRGVDLHLGVEHARGELGDRVSVVNEPGVGSHCYLSSLTTCSSRGWCTPTASRGYRSRRWSS